MKTFKIFLHWCMAMYHAGVVETYDYLSIADFTSYSNEKMLHRMEACWHMSLMEVGMRLKIYG